LSVQFQDMQADEEHDINAILCDPQTSGGLLFSVPAAQAEAVLDALHVAGVTDAAQIGSVLQADMPTIRIDR
ncbi:MAG: selenide, water dikinase SelD, partial [Chloroflexota bacterium]|nr:selenide, water dikinase SelD [Chloroflexota bacterium]